MGNKKGYCQFNEFKRQLLKSGQLFEGYPHRKHHKSNRISLNKSGMRFRRESHRIKDLESELKESYV